MEGTLSVVVETRRRPALFTKEQRDGALREVEEIRNSLSVIYEVPPENIPVCDLCLLFSEFGTEKERPVCYLVRHQGEAPERGFCMAFQVDPEKDPRVYAIFCELKAKHENLQGQV